MKFIVFLIVRNDSLNAMVVCYFVCLSLIEEIELNFYFFLLIEEKFFIIYF